MLLDKIKKRTMQSLGMGPEEFEALINADRNSLHDPFLYDGMRQLVELLHTFKLDQDANPHHLLVIDTDYDTDGVMSATVLSAALDVFNINHRVYVPSMEDGYGLSVKAVDDILAFGNNGYVVTTILTADNGTNAVEGVAYAKSLGLNVLVTDHHLGDANHAKYAPADVIVNPNKLMSDGSVEPYPFKGNAGATVAWKAMMAYATTYRPDAVELIYDLIVFAGIANVADVMPILDENRVMVKESIREFGRLARIHQIYGPSHLSYSDVKSTIYPHYNAAFHGLYDLITLLQKSKDDVRAKQGKKPVLLPHDEELISWYLSPMINAPRRIHATCREAMLSFLATNQTVRAENIQRMIEMNEEKSELRNAVLVEIHEHHLGENSNTLFVNTKHGISGLIAGQVAERTGNATIVFAMPTNNPTVRVYPFNMFDERIDAEDLVIGASARSNPYQPLNLIVERIEEHHPGIIVGGGGHEAAAGYSIRYKNLALFAALFDKYAGQLREEIMAVQARMVKEGTVEVRPENAVVLSFYDGSSDGEHLWVNVNHHQSLKQELMSVLAFQSQLKPFGKDFEGQTRFYLDIDIAHLTDPACRLDLNFWKTLKFFINGVTVLTFKTDIADLIKSRIASGDPAIMRFEAELKPNEFNGVTSPQLILSRKI